MCPFNECKDSVDLTETEPFGQIVHLGKLKHKGEIWEEGEFLGWIDGQIFTFAD